MEEYDDDIMSMDDIDDADVDVEDLDLEDFDTNKKIQKTRGIVKMEGVTKNRSDGKRERVRFNSDGQLVGEERHNVISTNGAVTKTLVSILFMDWRKVPKDSKEKIWEYIQNSFDVDDRFKRQCLQIGGSSFRSFRYNLTRHVKKYKAHPNRLRNPPLLYSFIQKGHWDAFVNDRLSKEFKTLSGLQKERQALNLYNHHLGRKGYNGLEEEIKKECGNPNLKVDRSVAWKMARRNPNGGYHPVVIPIVDTIDELTQLAKSGFITTSSENDILAQALKKPERNGRVTGKGRGVKPSSFFHTVNLESDWQREKRLLNEQIVKMKVTIHDLSKSSPKARHSNVCSNRFGSQDMSNETNNKTNPIFEKQKNKDVKKTFVATGTILEYRKPNVLVVIDMVLSPDAHLPIRTSELVYVSDGLGQHILWPEKLVSQAVVVNKMSKSAIKPSKGKLDVNAEVNTPMVSKSVIKPFKEKLEKVMKPGSQVKVDFEDTFSYKLHTYLTLEEIQDLIDMQELSQNCIAVYMSGIRMFLAKKGQQMKKINLKWNDVKVPMQIGNVECGYYVMRFMKEIIAYQSILCAKFNEKDTYNEDEINEIRSDWTTYVRLCGSVGGVGMITGTAVATVVYNLRQRHRTLDMPVIDYDLALLFQPMLVLGISIGVAFNVILSTGTRFPFVCTTLL
ncbi:hypothetical protein WN943_029122 [Citrus x changshan-huyou]